MIYQVLNPTNWVIYLLYTGTLKQKFLQVHSGGSAFLPNDSPIKFCEVMKLIFSALLIYLRSGLGLQTSFFRGSLPVTTVLSCIRNSASVWGLCRSLQQIDFSVLIA